MKNEKENQGIYEHDVYVRSLQGVRDIQEVAELAIVNSVNSKEYVFSIWNAAREFDGEKIKNEGLDSIIWLSDINENINLNVDRDSLETTINNNSYQSSLDDFLLDGAMQEVTQKIISYQNDDKNFIYKVPFEQLNMDMRTILIDEEIARMTRLAYDDELTKQDIIDFGKLVGHNTDINVGMLNHFKEPIDKALSDGVITPDEKQMLQFTLKAFQLEQPEVERTKGKEQENSKKRINKEIEYEMER